MDSPAAIAEIGTSVSRLMRAGETRPRMRSFSTSVNPRRGAAASVAAMAALFPELPPQSWPLLAEGLLRASPRGAMPPPILSARLRPRGPPGIVGDPYRALAERGWETPELLARAVAGRRALVAARVGGAWWQGGAADVPAGGGHVLVELADREGVSGEGSASAMLDRALVEDPAGRIVVLAPPTSGPGLRERLAAAAIQGARIIERGIDPWAVLDGAARVYTGGGEIGFLALIAGVPVGAFGDAFYTGWGATDDAPGVAQHDTRRTCDEIFAGVCLVATRYRDPFRDVATSFEQTLALLAEWRRLDEANRAIAACVGMSFWKRRRIADFVCSSAGVPVFRRSVASALAAARRPPPATPGAIAGWASRLPDGLAEVAARHGVPLIRVEDGFIRSVGLGSDFLPPASLVFDARGMYYDPRTGSDLEWLLRETEFDAPLLERAERLAVQLVARGITKYNLGPGGELDLPRGRRTILVPGQVEDDLSIVFGAGDVRANLGLLAAVRSANPDAFILYKPHPDVLAGHRAGAVPEGEARRLADAVVRDGSVAALLARADELHTMTSLAGFEALLRGRRVVVYGRPFYAGWGLTVDRPPFDRGRQLTLAQLVAGTLILYPRYLDPLTRLPCGPEVIIERLDCPELWRPGPLVFARRLQGMLVRRMKELRAGFSDAGGGGARHWRERPRP